MPYYTKQGHVKGSYEAYRWLLNNHPPINVYFEKNKLVLLHLGHKLLNAVQDAMDPYTFARDAKILSTYMDWDNKVFFIFSKPKLKDSPVWYVAEGLRERIVGYVATMEVEKTDLIKKLKQQEEDAVRFEPLRARQIAWEDERWQDLPRETIQEMILPNPDNQVGDFSKQVNKVLFTRNVCENLHIVIYEKLNGFYLGLVVDMGSLDENGKHPSLYMKYHELYEEVLRECEQYCSNNLPSMQPKAMDKVLQKVNRVMGNKKNIPSDINGNVLY
jgi:hypothetical protein